MTTSKSALAVQPYLFFGGRCEEAIEFYRKALDAQVERLVRFNETPEGQPGLPECFQEKVMHASLRIGETTIMA
ncbi:MAG TPA: VOC family protein, partial [Chthoniobacterales bacterium]